MRISRRQINGVANIMLIERRYGFAKWLQDIVLEMVDRKIGSIDLDENNPKLTEFCMLAKSTDTGRGRRPNDKRPKRV